MDSTSAKRIICGLLTAVFIACGALQVPAFAEEAEAESAEEAVYAATIPEELPEELSDERFDGKSWEEIAEKFITDNRLGERGRTALGYLNLVTGEEHYYDGDDYFIAASLYKVPLIMLYIDKIEAGEIDWDTKVGGVTLEKLAEGAIVHSDNTYAEMLRKHLDTFKNVRRMMAPLMGVDPDNVDPKYYINNFLTAEQYIHCLKLLYENSEKYEKIIEWMKQAEPEKYFNNRKQDYTIAHKYGWLEYEKHLYINDAGFAYTDDPIAIVMYTDNSIRPLEGLGEFCALMCDYSQYNHAVRKYADELAAERFEAEKAAAEEEARRIAQEEAENNAAVKAKAAAIAEAEKLAEEIAAEPPEEKTIDTRPLFIALAAAVAVAIVFVIVQAFRGKLATVTGILAVVLFAAAVAVCIGGAEKKEASGTGTAGDPGETVSAFMQAVCDGNWTDAYACISDYSSLGLENTPETDTGKMLYEAVRQNLSFELSGEAKVSGLEASQDMKVTYLDVNSLDAALKAAADEVTVRLAQELPADEVYSAGDEYSEDFADLCWEEAVRTVLGSGEAQLREAKVTVFLNFTDGHWLIRPGDALLRVLCGGGAV